MFFMSSMIPVDISSEFISEKKNEKKEKKKKKKCSFTRITKGDAICMVNNYWYYHYFFLLFLFIYLLIIFCTLAWNSPPLEITALLAANRQQLGRSRRRVSLYVSIFHGCMVWIEKYCHVGHWTASRGLLSDAGRWPQVTDVTLYTHDRYIFLHTLWFTTVDFRCDELAIRNTLSFEEFQFKFKVADATSDRRSFLYFNV